MDAKDADKSGDDLPLVMAKDIDALDLPGNPDPAVNTQE